MAIRNAVYDPKMAKNPKAQSNEAVPVFDVCHYYWGQRSVCAGDLLRRGALGSQCGGNKNCFTVKYSVRICAFVQITPAEGVKVEYVSTKSKVVKGKTQYVGGSTCTLTCKEGYLPKPLLVRRQWNKKKYFVFLLICIKTSLSS